MKIFSDLGRYYLLMLDTFSQPQKAAVFRAQVFREIDNLGISSLGIVAIISVFMGAVITIQMAYNIESPLIPRYTVGVAARDGIILEFAPTLVSLILAGKVGSNIASEIGSMRVSEQIDALEIMGVNSSQHLILPKITAGILINPVLIVIAMFVGILGGYVFGVFTGVVTAQGYIDGIQYEFRAFNVVYALIKTAVFAFIITSVSSYHGYYTSGGALEVGQSSTRAVVYSSIMILIFNFVLTQLLLA